MILIPLAVMFAGYQLVWYGYSLTAGGGIGFVELLKPSAIGRVDDRLSQFRSKAIGEATGSGVVDYGLNVLNNLPPSSSSSGGAGAGKRQ